MYVAERSAALHDAVRRHLVARFPKLAAATSYRAASAEPRWGELDEALEPYARTRALQQQVIISARDGFRCALDWFHGRDAVARGA
jgi:hypothetical protein